MRHDVGRISQWGLARDDDGRLVCSWGGGANPAHSFQLPAGYPIVQMKEHAPDYERTWGICPVWDYSDGGYDVQRRAHAARISPRRADRRCCARQLMPEWYGNARDVRARGAASSA